MRKKPRQSERCSQFDLIVEQMFEMSTDRGDGLRNNLESRPTLDIIEFG